jgi:hypothetical protein
MAKSLNKSPNLQATEVKGLTAKEIMAKMEDIDGTVVVNITKASESEKAALHEAASLLPAGKVELFVNTDEDSLLQAIVQELCDRPILFVQFLDNLWGESSEHFVTEWNEFVVGHEVAGKAQSVEQTHHWTNIGLGASDHPLREQVRQLIATVPSDFREKLGSLELKAHPFLTTESDIKSALLLAMVSNFVRGGVYYGLVSPSKTQGYTPRRVAYSLISK